MGKESEEWYMKERREIPQVLWPILETLNRLDSIKDDEIQIFERRFYEKDLIRNRKFSGKELLDNLLNEELLSPDYEGNYKSKSGTLINVIPSQYGRGKCCEVLLVFIGNRDNFEERILETIEHCGVICRGRTKFVIFYAMEWKSIVWARHKRTFQVMSNLDQFQCVVRKMFREDPLRII